GDGGRHHDRADQPVDRRALRLHRPAHPADEVAMTVSTDLPVAAAGFATPARRRGAWLRDWPLLPLVILVPFVLVALGANLIAPYDPTEPLKGAQIFQPPAWMADGNRQALLGTDFQGRDVLSRLIFGARVS